MAPVLERLPNRARVAVIRLRSLGDCVLTTPALDILKHGRPDLRVAVVVEDRFAPVFEGNDAVETQLPPSTERDEIVQECFRRGLLMLGCGVSTLRFCPPLVVTKEQCDTVISILDGVLQKWN